MSSDPARRKWLGYLVVLLAIACAAKLLRVEGSGGVFLRGLQWRLPESCWTRSWMGFECPGCGATRSFVLAGSGAWQAAWNMHPSGTILFASILMQIPVAAGGVAMGFKAPWREYRDKWALVLARRGSPVLIACVAGIFLLTLWHWGPFGIEGNGD